MGIIQLRSMEVQFKRHTVSKALRLAKEHLTPLKLYKLSPNSCNRLVDKMYNICSTK